MDSFLEKVTLYDFFSDFVPGALCLILCACGIFPELAACKAFGEGNFKGYIGFAFVILGYVLGVAISEIARIICTKIPQWGREKVREKFFCIGKKKTPKWLQKLNIDEQTLKNALVESGISQSSIESAKNICVEKNISLAEYFAVQMFADIQVDPNYKRIHNYSSSESMYKNLAFSFIFGALVPGMLKFFLHIHILERFGWLCGLEVFLAVIFFLRWKSFAKKKNLYTVSWFVEKYNKKENEEDKTKVSDRFLNIIDQYWTIIRKSTCGTGSFPKPQDQKDLAEKMSDIFNAMEDKKIPESIVSECRALYTILYALFNSKFNDSEARELFNKKYEEVKELLKIKSSEM